MQVLIEIAFVTSTIFKYNLKNFELRLFKYSFMYEYLVSKLELVLVLT